MQLSSNKASFSKDVWNTTWSSSSIVSAIERCKTMNGIRQFHAHLIKTKVIERTLVVDKLIAACCRSDLGLALDYALSVFGQVQNPNPYTFFHLIQGFSESSRPLYCLLLYVHMLSWLEYLHGVKFSIPSVLKACGKSRASEEGKQVHGQVLKTSLWVDPFVSNSLVRMYLELGEIRIARQLFDRLHERYVISWNSMITGYVRVGEIELAQELFDQMSERDVVTCNAMIDGYGKCGKYELAEEVFRSMVDRDIVTWTSMISAYVHNLRPMAALNLFKEMLSLGVQPDAPAIVSVLSAIADLGFVEEGKWIHACISENKLKTSSSFISSALIDMYARCGQIENAHHLFRSVSRNRKLGDWNSMISAFAIHGLGHEAVEVFLEMESLNIKPDQITFLGLLSACNHGGLVDQGLTYFRNMKNKYKMEQKIQHYGCIIDLLGRAGRLEEALQVLKSMPMEPDVLAWKAILSSGLKHGNLKIGKQAALKAIELGPKDSSSYILLSNVYAKYGRWNDVAEVRSIMKERGVKKIPGCSSIIVNGKIHEFLVGTEKDVKVRGEVLSKIEEMVMKVKLEGYETDRTQVLLNIEEEEKDRLLSLHSEKMALAFGLINQGRGAPIHIVKNLRICCDCHSFFKLVSRVYSRRIVVRDQNRSHHFENGSCCCNDYW